MLRGRGFSLQEGVVKSNLFTKCFQQTRFMSQCFTSLQKDSNKMPIKARWALPRGKWNVAYFNIILHSVCMMQESVWQVLLQVHVCVHMWVYAACVCLPGASLHVQTDVLYPSRGGGQRPHPPALLSIVLRSPSPLFSPFTSICSAGPRVCHLSLSGGGEESGHLPNSGSYKKAHCPYLL